jgi:hypothetical protein
MGLTLSTVVLASDNKETSLDLITPENNFSFTPYKEEMFKLYAPIDQGDQTTPLLMQDSSTLKSLKGKNLTPDNSSQLSISLASQRFANLFPKNSHPLLKGQYADWPFQGELALPKNSLINLSDEINFFYHPTNIKFIRSKTKKKNFDRVGVRFVAGSGLFNEKKLAEILEFNPKHLTLNWWDDCIDPKLDLSKITQDERFKTLESITLRTRTSRPLLENKDFANKVVELSVYSQDLKQDIPESFKNNQSLKRLSIVVAEGIEIPDLSTIFSNKKLESLSVAKQGEDEKITLKEILYFLHSGENLKHISIGDIKEDAQLDAYLKILKQATGLQSLSVSIPEMPKKLSEDINEVLLKNKELITLYFGKDTLSEDVLSQISEGLKAQTVLTSFSSWGGNITKTGAKELAPLLKNNKDLTQLSLTNNNMDGETVALVCQSVSSEKLTEIQLWGNSIGGETASKAILELITKQPTLRSLYLGYSNQDSEDFLTIMSGVKNKQGNIFIIFDSASGIDYRKDAFKFLDHLNKNRGETHQFLGYMQFYKNVESSDGFRNLSITDSGNAFVQFGFGRGRYGRTLSVDLAKVKN